jgi:hypothetical protein
VKNENTGASERSTISTVSPFCNTCLVTRFSNEAKSCPVIMPTDANKKTPAKNAQAQHLAHWIIPALTP